MSIETIYTPPRTKEEVYVAQFRVNAYDSRENYNEEYKNIRLSFEYDSIKWNDETGDRICSLGLGSDSEEYTDELGFGMEMIPYPDGSIREVPRYAMYLMIKKYGDELRVRRVAQKELAKIDAQREFDRTNNFETTIDESTVL